MNIIITISLAFVMLFVGFLFAVGWAKWYPKTRCQKISKNSSYKYNVCIKNKSHEGAHMSASGHEFKD